MALATRRCVVLTCDRCGDGWPGQAGEPHFDDRADALRYAAGRGWSVTAARAVCASCRRAEHCVAHVWSAWRPAGPFPAADGGTWRGRVRHCRICTAAEWDPPLRRRP